MNPNDDFTLNPIYEYSIILIPKNTNGKQKEADGAIHFSCTFVYTERMRIEHLIFDLDNTLYPASAAMDAGITRRMRECIMDFFHENAEAAAERRLRNIKNFSTTLEWLRHEGMNNVEAYFAHVHPQNEADELESDERLRPFLQAIPIPKIICTNAPREHAERVLAKLNVRDLFDDICDIRDFNLQGKPYASAFQTALKKADATIDDALFLDDLVKYTNGYAAIGGTSVLVGTQNGKPLSKDAAALFKGVPPHPGRTFRINSVYELPDLIERLQNE